EQHVRAESVADHAVQLLTLFFVDQKFITLLSILFGVGLAIQWSKARAQGRPFAGSYLRRMGLLFLLGLAHGLLLWYGDILLTYALVGVVALALSGLRRRATLVMIALCLAWRLGWELLLQTLTGVFGADWDTLGDRFSPEGQLHIFRDGPYGEIV